MGQKDLPPWQPPSQQWQPTPQQPWGPPPPRPPKKKTGVGTYILIGVAVFVGIIIAVAIAGAATKTKTAVAPAATLSPAPASAGTTSTPAANSSASKPPAATPAGPKILFQETGEGTHTTEQFTTSGPWTLTWSYSCAGTFGGSGNFIVDITQDDGFTADAGVNELGSGRQGVEHYYDAGTFHLEMNSECSWGVKVQG